MRRLICSALLLLLLLALLPGCSERSKEPVTFYYLRQNYQENMDTLIASEVREVSGHRDDLKYLLSFYLMGPADKELCSPLPRGAVLYQLEQTDTELTITLSDTSSTLSDGEFTLASACLSLTCMDLLPLESVTVASGSRNRTIRRSDLILTDTVKPEENAK